MVTNFANAVGEIVQRYYLGNWATASGLINAYINLWHLLVFDASGIIC
jgi:hypothetical protein